MPEQILIPVLKEDVGEKFITLGRAEGASNRPINERSVKALAANLETVFDAGVTLLKLTKDRYGILDGQHRFEAVRRFGNGHAYMAPASVWTAGEIRARHGSIEDFVSNLNKGRSFSSVDRLCVFGDRGHWAVLFEREGVDVVFKHTRTANYSWGTVVKARMLSRLWTRAQRIVQEGGALGPDAMLAEWESASVESIVATAEALRWWKPIASEIHRSVKLTSGYSMAGLAVAIVLYETNTKTQLDGCLSAIMRDPGIGELRTLNGPAVAVRLLQGLNYKRSSQRVTLFGWDGRGERP